MQIVKQGMIYFKLKKHHKSIKKKEDLLSVGCIVGLQKSTMEKHTVKLLMHFSTQM